jgi:hypothetical protein
MKKIIPLLFISTLAFANPTSIHFSSQGKYIVDQNGNRTKIVGQPVMICYEGRSAIKGIFFKEIQGKIYLLTGPNTIIKIDRPVCDLK